MPLLLFSMGVFVQLYMLYCSQIAFLNGTFTVGFNLFVSVRDSGYQLCGSFVLTKSSVKEQKQAT